MWPVKRPPLICSGIPSGWHHGLHGLLARVAGDTEAAILALQLRGQCFGGTCTVSRETSRLHVSGLRYSPSAHSETTVICGKGGLQEAQADAPGSTKWGQTTVRQRKEQWGADAREKPVPEPAGPDATAACAPPAAIVWVPWRGLTWLRVRVPVLSLQMVVLHPMVSHELRCRTCAPPQGGHALEAARLRLAL